MKLAAGDMVTLALVEYVDLFDQPFDVLFPNEDPVSFLTSKDTAVIVSLSSADGRCVYIMGPNGGGWTFGALFKRVK
jgi:hypothetical protein